MSPLLVPAFTAPVALIVSYGNNRVARRRALTSERYKDVKASADLLTTAVILPLNFLTFTALAYSFWFTDQSIRNSTVPCIVVAYWIVRFGIGRYGEHLPVIGQRLRLILLHNRRVDGLARVEPQRPPMQLDKL